MCVSQNIFELADGIGIREHINASSKTKTELNNWKLLYEPNAVLGIRNRSHFFYQCRKYLTHIPGHNDKLYNTMHVYVYHSYINILE